MENISEIFRWYIHLPDEEKKVGLQELNQIYNSHLTELYSNKYPEQSSLRTEDEELNKQTFEKTKKDLGKLVTRN